MTRPPDGELVLVIGNLTIDDVVLPTGVTHMAMLGGNSVHAATAVVTAGAKAALAARRGADFPPGALAALAEAGIDLTGLADIPGPTVRNWVIYEADGRRHWLYRTPPERSAEVAPEPADLSPALLRRAAVAHVAAMPLGNAERIVRHVRQQAPDAMITVDTHESWDSSVAGRVLALALMADLFVPSQEELAQFAAAGGAAGGPVDGLRALAAAGLSRAVVKAAGPARTCWMTAGSCTCRRRRPPSPTPPGPGTRSAAGWPGAGARAEHGRVGRARRGRGRHRDHRERQPAAAAAAWTGPAWPPPRGGWPPRPLRSGRRRAAGRPRRWRPGRRPPGRRRTAWSRAASLKMILLRRAGHRLSRRRPPPRTGPGRTRSSQTGPGQTGPSRISGTTST